MTNAANQAAHRARQIADGRVLIRAWVPAAIAGAVKATIAAMVAEHKGETE